MANTCECSIDKSCVHFFRSLSLPIAGFFLFSLSLYLVKILNSRIDFILKPEISLNAHFCDMIRAEKKKVGCDRDRCELLSVVHFREKRVQNVNNFISKRTFNADLNITQ